MIETIKAHLKSIVATTSTLIAIIVAVFTFDARYAHADDVKKEYSQTQLLVQQTTTNLRKQLLEDKLFELEVKRLQSKPNAIDEALRERYTRQLKELTK